jgi:hypothetical protein
MLVAEIHCPGASATADIENPVHLCVWVILGTPAQPSVKHHCEDVVLHV